MQCAIDGRNWREDGDLFLALAIGVHDAASAELAAKLWAKLWEALGHSQNSSPFD